jgi:hypothetical protein
LQILGGHWPGWPSQAAQGSPQAVHTQGVPSAFFYRTEAVWYGYAQKDTIALMSMRLCRGCLIWSWAEKYNCFNEHEMQD